MQRAMEGPSINNLASRQIIFRLVTSEFPHLFLKLFLNCTWAIIEFDSCRRYARK